MNRIGLLLALSACTVQPPDDKVNPMIDPPPDGGSTGPAPQLRLDSTLASTNYFSVPVSGKGPASGSLLVETPARGAYSTSIGPDGCFCLDVPLTPSTKNTLRFKAMDSESRYSPEVGVDVTQSGTPPGMPEPGVPTALARGGTVDGTTLTIVSLWGDTFAALTDGNSSTWVDLENSPWDDDWIAIRLAQPGKVDLIRVQSMETCPVKEFNLFISDVTSPGPAVAGATDWRFLYHETNGDGVSAYQLPMPAAASLIGIQFLSNDCYWPVSRHHVSEIEAFTPPPQPAGSEAPSCKTTTRTCS